MKLFLVPTSNEFTRYLVIFSILKVTTISVIRDQLVFFFSSSQQWGPQDQIRGYVVQKNKKGVE